MTKRMTTLVIAFGVLLLGGVCFAFAAPPIDGDARRTSWQHLALTHPGTTSDPKLARRINQLGDEGWELVDVSTVMKDGTTEKMVYFFKRAS